VVTSKDPQPIAKVQLALNTIQDKTPQSGKHYSGSGVMTKVGKLIDVTLPVNYAQLVELVKHQYDHYTTGNIFQENEFLLGVMDLDLVSVQGRTKKFNRITLLDSNWSLLTNKSGLTITVFAIPRVGLPDPSLHQNSACSSHSSRDDTSSSHYQDASEVTVTVLQGCTMFKGMHLANPPSGSKSSAKSATSRVTKEKGDLVLHVPVVYDTLLNAVKEAYNTAFDEDLDIAKKI